MKIIAFTEHSKYPGVVPFTRLSMIGSDYYLMCKSSPEVARWSAFDAMDSRLLLMVTPSEMKRFNLISAGVLENSVVFNVRLTPSPRNLIPDTAVEGDVLALRVSDFPENFNQLIKARLDAEVVENSVDKSRTRLRDLNKFRMMIPSN